MAALAGCSDEPSGARCDPKVENGARISSRGAPLTVCIGDTLELGFDLWECATHAEVTEFATWATDKPDIAVVERGVVRGVAAGTAKISAAHSGRTDTIDIAVLACAPGDGG